MAVELTTAQAGQIEAALAKGAKISAIKLYREFTGAGLKEAKDVIDQRSAELFRGDPAKYAKLAPRGAGCASAIAVVLGLAAAGVAAWLWGSAIVLTPGAR